MEYYGKSLEMADPVAKENIVGNFYLKKMMEGAF